MDNFYGWEGMGKDIELLEEVVKEHHKMYKNFHNYCNGNEFHLKLCDRRMLQRIEEVVVEKAEISTIATGGGDLFGMPLQYTNGTYSYSCWNSCSINICWRLITSASLMMQALKVLHQIRGQVWNWLTNSNMTSQLDGNQDEQVSLVSL